MKLYDHQESALEQTKDLNRVAYYLDMGLGKTFTASEKMIQLGSSVNLIVCQKSKVNDWIEHFKEHYCTHDHDYCTHDLVFDLTNKNQIERFLYESKCATEQHWMTDEETGQTYLQENLYPFMIVGIINYELAWRRPELLKLDNFTLILDESSLIQNRKAKQTKFILKMQPKNVILLSGTPCAGKYENLWTQARLLGWDISETLYNQQFINWETIKIGGMYFKQVNKRNPYKNVERLKQKFREHGSVFMKTEEVFNLPEQTFIDVKVDNSKEYKKFMKTSVITIDEKELVGDTTLTKMLYARQLCGMYSKNKQEAFKDILESTNDRLIVFYNFTEELNILKGICEGIGRPTSIVNGSVKDLSNYEEESDSVTCIQYQAGAMGLNLQKANKVIYYTLPLRSELFEQSKKRIHRIGQKNSCFYYSLICKGTIEERIQKTLEERKDFTNALFEQVDCMG